MAKIPRINSGDRPSGVYSPTLDASVSNMMGSLGDLSGEMLQTATAEELAERKKWAEAAAAKKAIVDASNAGVVAMELDERNAKTLAELAAQYPNDPKKIPDEYLKITAKWPQEIQDRADLNNEVKLDAVKRVESTRVSGYKQAHSISSELETSQVKGNLARKESAWIDAARRVTTEQGLRNLFVAVNSDPDYVAVRGAGADEDRFKQEKKMVQANLEFRASDEPITILDIATNPSKFYGERVDDMPALAARAERAANDFANRDALNTVVKYAKTRGVLVSAALKGGKMEGADFATSVLVEREALQKAIENIPNERQLTKEAKAQKRKTLEAELGGLDAIEILRSRNLESNPTAIGATPPGIWIERDALFSAEGGKPSLDAIMSYERNVMKAVADKLMSPARATTLLKEVELSRPEAIAAAVDNTGGFFSRSDVQAGQLALKDEINKTTNGKGLSPEALGRVTEKYVGEFVKYTEKNGGRPPSREEAVKMARQAYYDLAGIGRRQGLR